MQCSPCERGRFNSQRIAAKCRPCPSGTYSAPGATECLVCGLRDVSQRTVETADDRADGDVGNTSPYGIDCEDGVVGARRRRPFPEPNPNPNPYSQP